MLDSGFDMGGKGVHCVRLGTFCEPLHAGTSGPRWLGKARKVVSKPPATTAQAADGPTVRPTASTPKTVAKKAKSALRNLARWFSPKEGQ